MKVGIIRCMQTEDFCPGTTDFKMIRERKGVFEGITEDIDIVGFCNCGGRPAKKSVLRARELVRRGAAHDRFRFVGIQKGTPLGYPCPCAKKMKTLIERDLPEGIRFLDYTHEAPPEMSEVSAGFLASSIAEVLWDECGTADDRIKDFPCSRRTGEIRDDRIVDRRSFTPTRSLRAVSS